MLYMMLLFLEYCELLGMGKFYFNFRGYSNYLCQALSRDFFKKMTEPLSCELSRKYMNTNIGFHSGDGHNMVGMEI